MAYGVPSIDSTAAELYSTYSDDLCNGIDGALHDKTTDLAACLRADARRFAAYKAHYVETAVKNLLNDEKTPAEQRQANAERAMRTFQRWGQTERNYAVQSTQMAEKWQEFEKDGDRYLLQYRTAHDEKVRATHAALHNTTLPPDDPFWDEYYPPLGWNCRCTVVQVRRGKYPASDSSTSIANGRAATEKTPSFRFNPGKQRKCFPDNVSYLKHAGANRKERDKVEEKCEKLSMKQARQMARYLTSERTLLSVEGEQREVIYTPDGISHCVQDMLGRNDVYWLKNEVLPQINRYIAHAEYMGKKVSDTGHNSRSRTINLKQNTDYYYYYKIQLPSGQECYIHLGHYKTDFVNAERAGNMYLYSITKKLPTDIETP